MNLFTKTKYKILHRVAPYIKSDEMFLRLKWRIMMDYPLDLNNPKTFNEKLQWLKLYDRRPEYIQMVDKAEAKKYVASIIGEDHIIQTLAIYDSVDKIDFDSLPNQFVLKCTHDSGGVVICKDKRKLDLEKTKKKLSIGLKTNFFYQTREWPYKNVRPRIIAEKYLENKGDDGLTDYKIHNFNGVPKLILVCKNRYKESGLTEDFFTCGWEHINLKRPNVNNDDVAIKRPPLLEDMLNLSRKLSQGTKFVRTDFYTMNDKIYFGEITFYPASGFKQFEPFDWDRKLGDWLMI